MFFAATPYAHISEVIFVGDPMCSWCYGFGPELGRLREELKGVPFSMIMGGLRDGEIFDEAKLKNHLGYWQAVHEATGLPFDDTRRLVIDIGGGSTELIVGRQINPGMMESVHMGCVSWTQEYFRDGAITAKRLRTARLAASAAVNCLPRDYLA